MTEKIEKIFYYSRQNADTETVSNERIPIPILTV